MVPDLLFRGTEHIIPAEELRERLDDGDRLRVKLGLDPTASQVTLGWAVVLRKLRQFQEHGHTAVLIVGDFTAQVGDPSLKSETRKRLSAEEVRGHAENVLGGFRKVLLPDRLEIRYNSEWLGKLSMEDVLELTAQMTVAQMLERDDFSKRYEGGQPISMLEFMYPFLQGYDSVAVEADVELGGTDQLWNLMVGREIQKGFGQRPQAVMTVPLLVGTDGSQKMSQSLDNYIGIDDAPADMFGKVMSIPDEAMPSYFELASGLPGEAIDDTIAGLEGGSLHPGETKRLLAKSIVTLYWDQAAADDAEQAFDSLFRDGSVPETVEEQAVGQEDPVYLPGFLRAAGLVKSGGEALRLIDQRAVKVDGVAVETPEIGRDLLIGRVVQVGKRRFVRATDG